jgi:uncharacterized protein YjbJ (UPF0337 family)
MTNTDNMIDKAKNAMGDAGEAAHGMAETLKSGARDAAAKVSDRASRSADNAKDSLADEVGSVATALRNAAKDMRSGSTKERTFSQIADSLADVSEAVHDKDLGEMVDDVSAFARRNPLMFLGGAALLGFAASRLIKASDNDRRSSYDQMSGTSTRHGYRPAPSTPATAPSYPASTPQKVRP